MSTMKTSKPNTIVINRHYDGFSVHAVATYVEETDEWKCTVTSGFGYKDTRYEGRPYATLEDMINYALDADEKKVAA